MSAPSPAPEESPPPRPGWVKVSLIVGAVVLGVVVLAMVLSGGEHGPGRHLPGGDGHTPPVEHAP